MNTTKVKIICDDEKRVARIKGKTIKLVDVIKKACHRSENPIEEFQVFATDTILIDANLTLPGTCMFMISPNWAVEGSITIDLSGTDGTTRDKALDGIVGDRDGEDGGQGNAGMKGGDFYAVGMKFTKIDSLKIISKGGNGGPGQEGGDGANGRDGQSASLDNYQNFEYEKVNGRWRIYGDAGETGGNGGDGGIGGKGGEPGTVKFELYRGDKSKIKVEAKRGKKGVGGNGGKPGKGGATGKDVTANWVMCCWSGSQVVDSEVKKAADGVKGRSNHNTKGAILYTIHEVDISSAVDEYCHYLNRSLHFHPDDFHSDFLEYVVEVKKYLSFNAAAKFTMYNSLQHRFDGNYSLDNIREQYKILMGDLREGIVLPKNPLKDRRELFQLMAAVITRLHSIDNETEALEAHFLKKVGPSLQEHDKTIARFDSLSARLDKILTQTYEHTFAEMLLADSLDKAAFGSLAQTLTIFEYTGAQLIKLIKKLIQVPEKAQVWPLGYTKKIPEELDLITKAWDVFTKAETLKKTGKIDDLIKGSAKKILDYIHDMELRMKVRNPDNLSEFVYVQGVDLEISKWDIANTFKEIRFEVRKLSTNDRSEILEILSYIILYYEKIERFYRQKKLQDHIDVIHNFTNSKNKGASPLRKDLFEDMKINILLSNYRYIVDSVKLYTFPYIDWFKEFNPLGYDFLSARNATALEDAMHTKINELANKMSTREGLPVRETLDSMNGQAEPIAVWRQSHFKKRFERLFSGEEVEFKPYIGDEKWFGVQVVCFDFRFNTTTDPAMMEENIPNLAPTKNVDLSLLDNIYLNIYHIGNSFYKCGNKTFLIRTIPVNFGFTLGSYDKKINKSETYVELCEKGDPCLSPYTTWTMQLEGPYAQFRNVVSAIELVGKFKYYNQTDGCNEADHLYELYSPLPELNVDSRSEEHEVEDQKVASSASFLSSPLNNVINWFLTPVSMNTSLETNQMDVYSRKLDNAFSLSDRTNSSLILGSTLVCYLTKWLFSWRSHSNVKSEIKSKPIAYSRIVTWKKFVNDFQAILVKYNFRMAWLINNLQDAMEEIDSMLNGSVVEAMESRLIAVLVDFLEEIQYYPNLNRKCNENLKHDIDGLIKTATAMSKFKSKLKML